MILVLADVNRKNGMDLREESLKDKNALLGFGQYGKTASLDRASHEDLLKFCKLSHVSS